MAERGVDVRRYKVAFQRSAFKAYQALRKPSGARVDEVLSVLSINPLSEILQFKKLRPRTTTTAFTSATTA